MKKLLKDTKGILTSGATMSIGASIGSKLGGTAGTNLSASMSGMSAHLPTVGAISGLGATAKQLKKLKM